MPSQSTHIGGNDAFSATRDPATCAAACDSKPWCVAFDLNPTTPVGECCGCYLFGGDAGPIQPVGGWPGGSCYRKAQPYCAPPSEGVCLEGGGVDNDCCAVCGNGGCAAGYTFSTQTAIVEGGSWDRPTDQGFYPHCGQTYCGNTCCTPEPSPPPPPQQGPYPIKIFGGTNSGETFLSTTAAGQVNLHHSDDGSGRQRWTIERGSGDWYNIKIFGGTNSGETFLSTTAAGQVDLFHRDDGSGRQRWVIDGFQVCDVSSWTARC